MIRVFCLKEPCSRLLNDPHVDAHIHVERVTTTLIVGRYRWLTIFHRISNGSFDRSSPRSYGFTSLALVLKKSIILRHRGIVKDKFQI